MFEIEALINIKEYKQEDIFKKGGLTPLLENIKEQALSIVPDTSTKKGRDTIRSTAYLVARSKTFIDKKGEEFVKDIKKKVKIVDAERARGRAFLDELKAEVRKPLTLWEEEDKKAKKAEQERVENLKNRIEAIREYMPRNDSDLPLAEFDRATATQLFDAINFLKKYVIDKDDFQELTEEAQEAKESRIKELTERLDFQTKKEEQEKRQKKLDEEKERLEKEKEEQQRKEQERKAQEKEEAKQRQEAVDHFIKNVEACDWKQETWKDAIVVSSLISRLESLSPPFGCDHLLPEGFVDRKQMILKKLQAGLPLAEKADKQAAEEKLKAEAQAEKEKAERERQAQEEQKRQEDEKRRANVAHRRKINQGVMQVLMENEFTQDQAFRILELIVRNKIPNVSIQY